MQAGCSRARCRLIGDIAGTAGEREAGVVAGNAFAVPQIALVGAALRHAFAAEEFQRVGFAGHRHAPVAKADACHGLYATAAIIGIAAHAGAAVAGVGGEQRVARWAGASIAACRSAVANDDNRRGSNRRGSNRGRRGDWERSHSWWRGRLIAWRRRELTGLACGWCALGRLCDASSVAKLLPGEAPVVLVRLREADRRRE